MVPHAGLRGTYYSRTGDYTDQTVAVPGSVTTDVVTPKLNSSGDVFRFVIDAGTEASFKLSRSFEGVQSRIWGLDGFRHVLQPYLSASYIRTSEDPSHILQFDRINPSTQAPPIEFPELTGIDSISNQAIVQLGARNRFETRRDNYTFTWLEWNGFINLNVQRPQYEKTFLETSQTIDASQKFNRNASLRNKTADPGTFSNLYNTIRWTPVPWASLVLDTQLPVFDKGFTQVNTSLQVLATPNLQLTALHRYLSGDVYFDNSNQLILGANYRIDDNWGVSFQDAYEFNYGRLESQRYEVHRDLSSWIATFGLVVGDNGGGKEDFGVELIFTLKDLPLARLPFNFNPDQLTGGSSKNP